MEAPGDGWEDVGEVTDCPQLTVEEADELQEVGLALPDHGHGLLPGLDTPSTSRAEVGRLQGESDQTAGGVNPHQHQQIIRPSIGGRQGLPTWRIL